MAWGSEISSFVMPITSTFQANTCFWWIIMTYKNTDTNLHHHLVAYYFYLLGFWDLICQVLLSRFILCCDCFLVHLALMSYLNDLHRASSLKWSFQLVLFNSKFPTAAEHAGNKEINKTFESQPHRSDIQRNALLHIFVSGHFISQNLAWGENIMWHLTSSASGWINIILVWTLSEYTRDKLLLMQVNFKLIAHHLQPPWHSEQTYIL